MLIKIIFLLTFLSCLMVSPVSYGQELLSELPTTKEEFIASEPKLLATIDWLDKTAFDKDDKKRDLQKVLFITWLTNSPTISIEINMDVVTFTKKNPDLLLSFMGGWTKYSLQNNYSRDQINGSIAGIRNAISVYKNLNLKKDNGMEKLILLEEKGELESWVKEKFKKN